MFLVHDVIVEGQVAVALQVAQLVIIKLATIVGAGTVNKIIVVCCSSTQLCFLWKVIRLNGTDVTSRRMQSKKEGRGLLHEVNRSEGECFVR